jgi:DNA-binding XRE family transcriptional regulator
MDHVELREARRKLGMTQTELADVLGLSMRALQEIEAGRSPVRKMLGLAMKWIVHERASDAPKLIDPQDVDAVVSAMQTHLESGAVGFHGMLSPHQMNYRECYHAVCLLSAEWSNDSREFDIGMSAGFAIS